MATWFWADWGLRMLVVLSLDCIDLLFCWTWAGCGFKSRIGCFLISSMAYGRGLERFQLLDHS
ncbi:hypothetical protein HanLR1_Chr10g0366611 [Helianthus annuus]|nr:hypothetical protein HanLR1_Chr10g0366611 [Helianthus annuus]